jgi:hypothetical protein
MEMSVWTDGGGGYAEMVPVTVGKCPPQEGLGRTRSRSGGKERIAGKKTVRSATKYSGCL